MLGRWEHYQAPLDRVAYILEQPNKGATYDGYPGRLLATVFFESQLGRGFSRRYTYPLGSRRPHRQTGSIYVVVHIA